MENEMVMINKERMAIGVPIRMMANTGKIRIKRRSCVNEYGAMKSTLENEFSEEHYAEWMIGYDVAKASKKFALTSLPQTEFIGANKKHKSLYELSEYVWYFYQWGVIELAQLEAIEDFLARLSDEDLLSKNRKLQIRYSGEEPVVENVNGFVFQRTSVEYPLLVHEFEGTGIVCEIKVTEQQYGMSIQPMLCLCIPIMELTTERALVGRKAVSKEMAMFWVTRENIGVFLETLEMIGTLSPSHRHDVLEILKVIKG